MPAAATAYPPPQHSHGPAPGTGAPGLSARLRGPLGGAKLRAAHHGASSSPPRSLCHAGLIETSLDPLLRWAPAGPSASLGGACWHERLSPSPAPVALLPRHPLTAPHHLGHALAWGCHRHQAPCSPCWVREGTHLCRMPHLVHGLRLLQALCSRKAITPSLYLPQPKHKQSQGPWVA